jgi:low affinity Fe/Cu permease
MLVSKVAKIISTPYAILLTPALTLFWFLLRFDTTLYAIISTQIGITITQIILADNAIDTSAMQVKMDEIIRVDEKANNALVGIEHAQK